MARHLTADATAVVHAVSRTPSRPASAELHWREYAIEAVLLGTFMLSACAFATLFEHPASPFRQAVDDPLLRRLPMGLAMGLTAVGLIYSAWGQRSGAHLNPAVTLTFLRLGKVAPPDAVGYLAGQLVGGIAGVQVGWRLLGGATAHPAVNHVATVPGPAGPLAAFGAEVLISSLLMLVVLTVSNTPRIARLTGLCAGLLVMTYIVVEAPISGMSMNPARSLGSALAAGALADLWIYLTAPPLGMLLAAQTHAWVRGRAAVRCAKLVHPRAGGCHFRCSVEQDGSRVAP